MAGAGVLPGRAAAEARRQGWRVVAFAFEEAPGLAAAADVVVPAAIGDIQAVLMRLYIERPQAALFVGKFWKQRAFEEAERSGKGAISYRGAMVDYAMLPTAREIVDEARRRSSKAG